MDSTVEHQNSLRRLPKLLPLPHHVLPESSPGQQHRPASFPQTSSTQSPTVCTSPKPPSSESTGLGTPAVADRPPFERLTFKDFLPEDVVKDPVAFVRESYPNYNPPLGTPLFIGLDGQVKNRVLLARDTVIYQEKKAEEQLPRSQGDTTFDGQPVGISREPQIHSPAAAFNPNKKFCTDGIPRVDQVSNTRSALGQTSNPSRSGDNAPVAHSQDRTVPRLSTSGITFGVPATRSGHTKKSDNSRVNKKKLHDTAYVREITASGNNGKFMLSMDHFRDREQFRMTYAALNNKPDENLADDVSLPRDDMDRRDYVTRTARAMMNVDGLVDVTTPSLDRKKRKEDPSGQCSTESTCKKRNIDHAPDETSEFIGHPRTTLAEGEDDREGGIEEKQYQGDDLYIAWIKHMPAILFEDKAWQLVLDAEAAQRGHYNISDYKLNLGAPDDILPKLTAVMEPVRFSTFVDRMEALIAQLRVRKDLVMSLFDTPFSRLLAANPRQS